MRIVPKAVIAGLTAVLLGAGASLALGTARDEPVRASRDVKGPCDEAEHANDPRCTGRQVPEDDDGAARDGGVDLSGPCDEAEHANDPRCSGGPDSGDNSGPSDNSRPSDSSGPGSGGDDDNSGSEDEGDSDDD